MLLPMEKAFDMEGAVRFQKERLRRLREKRAVRLKQARRDFEAISGMIIEKYKPAAIYQWGSLLRENHFSEISDIDIAVEGITSPEDFFSLLGEAMQMTEFPLDIVQMEKIEPEFRSQILKRGRVVYERP